MTNYLLPTIIIFVDSKCTCSSMARIPAFQAGYAGSIPATCSIKKNNQLWLFFFCFKFYLLNYLDYFIKTIYNIYRKWQFHICGLAKYKWRKNSHIWFSIETDVSLFYLLSCLSTQLLYRAAVKATLIVIEIVIVIKQIWINFNIISPPFILM